MRAALAQMLIAERLINEVADLHLALMEPLTTITQ